MTDRQRRRVAVVTGGGGGIGTAVAHELARRDVAVVAMDPGTGLQGEPLGEPTAEQTARRITAEGGAARASSASVTDPEAVRALFAEVTSEFGGLDIVVNTAGILRFAPFLEASEDDWRAVLDVHLNGYLNVLAGALPVMAAAGYGRIVGVTSGAGLARAAADSAHYSCAKRAVAAVTWGLAHLLPDGVALNALSPLAATRMVTGGRSGGSGPAGLDLSAMPAPQDMAPAAAYLAGEPACRGQVIFSAGPELSLIAPPRLIEAVRTGDTADFAASLDTLIPVVLAPAEDRQRSTGGSNARFGPVFDQPGTTGPVAGPAARRCLVVAGNAALAGALAPALARCGMTAVEVADQPVGFAAAEEAMQQAAAGGIDAIVIAPGSFAAGPSPPTWEETLAGYASTADRVLVHAGWLRAAAREAARTSRPLRVVHLADATSPPQYPAAQAIAQLARCANLAGASLLRPDLIDVFSIAMETAEPADHQPVAQPADHQPVAQLAARLLWSGDAGPLRGAELVARPGWIGIRSHPGPAATASYGSAAIPPWIGDWLAEAASRSAGTTRPSP
jgi:NAD(P)-dependent dehydrogenase (short-subunit alcohol dehydrogenase family)